MLMADTWNYLVTLLPGLAEVDIEYKGGKAELTQMTFGAYDAVGWVTDPTNLNHAMLTAVRANENLALMDFDDPSLGSELPDGRLIYEIKNVSIDADASKPKLKTVCTTALLFARPDVDEALAKELSAVVGLGVLRK